MQNEIKPEHLSTFYDSYTSLDITRSYRLINTPSEFARENLFYLQEVGYLKSLISHIKQREQLNSFLLLIVVSGSGHFTYKGKTYELEPGECIFINCNYHYSHQSSQEDPWELMWIHFNGKNIVPYISYYESAHPDVVLHTEIMAGFISIIECCLELGKKKDVFSEFQISKLITDLLTLCITKKEEVANQSGLEKINRIKEYIDQYFQNRISLGRIAEEFYISKYYLAREFKKYFGMSIGDYICCKRVTYSKELLRFTNKTIEEVSALCGIPDTNYFAKVFRRLEECSPSEYRRKW